MDNIISNREDVPKWMALGKTVLCQKDPSKGNAVDNCRPILCLLLMLKLMTGTIAESIYNLLDVNDKLPVEQKGCKEKSRGTKDQLSIDKMILQDCRKRHTNLGIVNINLSHIKSFNYKIAIYEVKFYQCMVFVHTGVYFTAFLFTFYTRNTLILRTLLRSFQ